MKVKNRSKKIIKFLKNRQGTSVLLLVFIIIVLLSLLVFSLQLLAILSARRANQFRYSETAFFAAEGALLETIQHLRNDPNWPDLLPDDDEYTIGEATIKRIITEPEAGTLRIDINADNMGAKRRLSATFSRSTGERAPLDIILVIDRSGSMGGQPLADAKSAAIEFVNMIEVENAGDKIGLVSYSDSATVNQELTDEYDDVKGSTDPPRGIEGLSASGRTNIGAAIYQAVAELDGGENTPKVIVLLSDGVANRNHDGTCSDCEGWPCLDPNDDYDPADEFGQRQGNCCTYDAVSQANIAKSSPKNYIVFSILLNNITGSDCGNTSSTENLGRLTLLRASGEEASQPLPGEDDSYVYYKETNDSSELKNIYAEIAQKIISPEFFEIKEEIPEPD